MILKLVINQRQNLRKILIATTLVATANMMRKDKKFPSGRTIDPAPKLFIGGAEVPSKGKPNTEKILGKIKNGVDFFQTQYVFEAKKIRRIHESFK